MELKLLEDFLCLADQRSFSRAAELRHITQSTFSKRIRTLEGWFGVDLIDRSSHPVQLTAEGAAAISQSREIVQMMRGLRNGISSVPKQKSNSVSFATLHTLIITFIPSWRRALEAQTGELEIGRICQNTDYGRTLRQLRQGEVDFLLTYAHPAVAMNLDKGKFEKQTLARERVIPVSAPTPDGRPLHPIREDSVLDYLSYGSTSFFALALNALFEDRPLALNVMTSNPMCVGLRSLVLVGTGMAWLPESLVRRDLAEGRMVSAGGEEWELSVDIQLIRNRSGRSETDGIWEATQYSAIEAQGHLGAELLL